jgi:hypothetical protein
MDQTLQSTNGGAAWIAGTINDGTEDIPSSLTGCVSPGSGAVYIAGRTAKKMKIGRHCLLPVYGVQMTEETHGQEPI